MSEPEKVEAQDRENFFAQMPGNDDIPEVPEVQAEEDEEPKEEAPKPAYDPTQLASQIHQATLSAFEQAEARRESRRRSEERPQERPRPEPPKIDPERLLSDERYALEAIEKIAAHKIAEAEGNYRPTIDSLQSQTQAMQSVLSAAIPYATQGAYQTAGKMAVRRGLVGTEDEFESLGTAIGQVLKARVDAGQANWLSSLSPDAILQAADYAVHEMGVKPMRRKTKPEEVSIGTGDRQASKGPKINNEAFKAVEARLGRKISDARKRQHAEFFSRRAV